MQLLEKTNSSMYSVVSNPFRTETVCPVCGSSFYVNSVGRTREYCSADCSDLNKFLNAFETRMLRIKFFGKSSNFLKRRIFQIANNLVCK